MTQLIECFTSPGIYTELMHAFVAADLTRVGQNLQSEERIVIETVTKPEARRRLRA